MTAAALLLIVEDNVHNLKLARDVLGHVGYATVEARDGERRSSWRARAGPDMILMDIQLPGMDGLEALARLRADPATARHPGGRVHRVRDEGRPRALPRGRVPRLSREADQRARLPVAGGARCWRSATAGAQT